MKKIIRKLGLICIIITITLLSFVACFERSLGIKGLDINAVIMPNGDVNVEEVFNYRFNGSYQGVFREYKSVDCDGYIINNISIIDKTGTEIVVEESTSESPNTYTNDTSYSGTYLKIFTPSNNESKKVKINYTIKGAVRKYTDCAALYWNFYSVPEDTKVKKGSLKISLSDDAFNNDLFYKMYGEGSIKAKIGDNNESLNISFKRLSGMIGVQLKFQNEYLNEDSKKSYMAFDKYLEIKAFKFQEGMTIGEWIIVVIGCALFFGAIYGIIKLCKWLSEKRYQKALAKYRLKRCEGSNLNLTTDNCNIPSNISPAYINLIWSEFKEENLAIIDVMFYLANKGVYTIEKEGQLVFKYSGDNRNKELDHLENLIKWMNEYDEGNGINLEKIHKKLKEEKYAMQYVRDKRKFGNIVIKDAIKDKVIVKIKGRYVVSNEFYDEWTCWTNYRDELTKRNKNAVIVTGEYIPVTMIYSISLCLTNKELKAVQGLMRDVMNKSLEYEKLLKERINAAAQLWLVTNSFSKMNFDTLKIYKDSSSSGSTSSSSSFSGGGGGSSGGF